MFWSFITGVLEEAKFFGISSILEQLEEMVKVPLWKFYVCHCALLPWQEKLMNLTLNKCTRQEIKRVVSIQPKTVVISISGNFLCRITRMEQQTREVYPNFRKMFQY